MLARIHSAAVLGVEAYIVAVETDLSGGLPSFATVGLPQGAVKEGRERVNAAIVNAGFDFPLRRITVNLAPADVRKQGSAFDLPIALGILAASEQIPAGVLEGQVCCGELGLQGDLRPVRGALPMALGARAAGFRGIILPAANLSEAAVVDGIEVAGRDNAGRGLPSPHGRTADRAHADRRPGTDGRTGHRPGGLRRRAGAGRRPSGPSKSRRPVATTSCCSARRARGRRCWPAGSRPSFRR